MVGEHLPIAVLAHKLLFVPSKNPDKLTPAMRQYKTFKDQHPDCILFFRMGDFYEVFYDDAILCHKILGITLTKRTEGVPMAGVPYHSVETYLQRMLAAGYKVAIGDQIQDPKEAKGVVDRAVTRVLTAGTLVDESLLDESRASRVAAAFFHEAGETSPASVAIVELATGSFELLELTADKLPDELARLAVNELCYVETANGEPPPRITRLNPGGTIALTGRPSWHFRPGESREALFKHFGVTTLAGFGLSDDDPALPAAGALLTYLIQTQDTNAAADAPSRLSHLRPPTRRSLDTHVTLDAVTIRNLEIERTMQTGSLDGSLLGVFNACCTPMGKRTLRDDLCFPLRSIAAINARLDLVESLVTDRPLADELGEQLSDINDVARIAARLALGRATPRDLVALGRSVDRIDDMIAAIDQRDSFKDIHQALSEIQPLLRTLADEIKAACVDSPPAHMREGGLIADGVDADLDESRALETDASSYLANLQKQLITDTGIKALKVGYNRVFGYYIEVPRTHSSKVPDIFSRKQTLKNAERYITPELKTFESKILHARQRAVDRELQLFEAMCKKAANLSSQLSVFAATCARIDVLRCFAQVAVRHRYTRPTLIEKPVLDISAGRHPVLDCILENTFVPNDTELLQGQSLALITGPNMAGKSTFIRQNALLTLLAHTGSFIPAESAIIGLTDRIFTRIGAGDELHAGRSTFMVEMTETAHILHHATDQSLIILDEIGRGTSTLDGLSLAWSIAESLANLGARTLFATHYHEITAIADELPNVQNLHVAVREWGDDIIFVYRIQPGRTDRSYGLHVAKIAGLPTAVLTRAQNLLSTLEVQSESAKHDIVNSAAKAGGTSPVSDPANGQLPLFTQYLDHPALEKLRQTSLDALTPLQAFDLLRELQHESTPEP